MKIKKFSKMLSLCSFIFLLSGACNVEEKVPALGDRIAGAVDIAKAPSGNLFYVLNSDYERAYDKGSIVMIDPDAPIGSQKVGAIKTPRMGRSISVEQNLMLVTYADAEARSVGTVELWDLANERAPQLITTLKVDCSPLNGILSPTKPYFTVGCIEGSIYVGKNPRNTPEAPLSFDIVRSYGYEHRALYFYEAQGKTFLLGFPTDIDDLSSADATDVDVKRYDPATDSILDGANGVPDAYELTVERRRQWQLAAPYQMFVYPVTDEETISATEKAAGATGYSTFRYITRGSFTKPSVSDLELRYVYFNLLEANGQGNSVEQVVTADSHRYRTNFWTIKPSLDGNASVFYMSHRGNYGTESNNVLKVVINDAALLNYKTSNFEQMFQVDRVYGFQIDRDNRGRYPCDFALANIGGQSMLLINSFRDLIYFSNAPFYSITRKFLDGPQAAVEVPSSKDSSGFGESYYQVAVSNSGKVLTSSFYGNVLYLFDAAPGISIKDQTPTRIE